MFSEGRRRFKNGVPDTLQHVLINYFWVFRDPRKLPRKINSKLWIYSSVLCAFFAGHCLTVHVFRLHCSKQRRNTFYLTQQQRCIDGARWLMEIPVKPCRNC
jgi:hypothetical protein